MLPRACMGVVANFFLEFKGSQEKFLSEVGARFPCCMAAAEDLTQAVVFWNEFSRCVRTIAEPLGAEELNQDIQFATQILEDQRRLLNGVTVQ
mmetsp:Transcript_55099/g.112512  ORF Transcript_55099/g.112512 Transcript_55099/m.112512 type:complete len:93 (+) Transcript_55099:73-351(+)